MSLKSGGYNNANLKGIDFNASRIFEAIIAFSVDMSFDGRFPWLHTKFNRRSGIIRQRRCHAAF
jgi:hypothetical protein